MRRARGTAGTTGVEMEFNAGITRGVAEACAKFCPGAILAVIVIPVELYKKMSLDPSKIMDATTLDCVRANRVVAEETGKNANYVRFPPSTRAAVKMKESGKHRVFRVPEGEVCVCSDADYAR